MEEKNKINISPAQAENNEYQEILLRTVALFEAASSNVGRYNIMDMIQKCNTSLHFF